MNRIDPDLFAACFTAWANEQRCEAGVALVAIDGKTSRRSHDRAKGRKALHLVSAWAAGERLVLGQEAVDGKSNEITAIPALLARLDGALVTIDAIACNPTIARTIHRGRRRRSAGGQGQPADPARRDSELLRRRPGG